jgi:hypothetical protein
MAVGFNASGDYAKRNANLPSIQTYTIAGWVKLRAEPSDWAFFLGMEDSDSSASGYALIGWDNAAGEWRLVTDGVASVTFSPQPSDDGTTWLYWFIRSTSTANQHEAGYADGDDVAFTKALGGVANWTPARLCIGNDSYDEWVDCAAAYVRVWDAELSDAELLDERDSTTPVRTSNLRADWPLANNTDNGDDSGNGYDLTFGGTLTTETGPSIGGPAATSLLLPNIMQRPIMKSLITR